MCCCLAEAKEHATGQVLPLGFCMQNSDNFTETESPWAYSTDTEQSTGPCSAEDVLSITKAMQTCPKEQQRAVAALLAHRHLTASAPDEPSPAKGKTHSAPIAANKLI